MELLLFLQWVTREQQLEQWCSRLERTHQSSYELIDDFKGEQAVTEVTLQQLDTGANPPPRKSYRQLDKRVERVNEISTGSCVTRIYITHGMLTFWELTYTLARRHQKVM